MSRFISIVLPVYNKEKYVAETIQSVLSQSYEKFELIVVNDGSSDNSEEIIKTITDDRIRYYFQENQGVSATRNNAVKEAKYEFIAFIDGDDLWESEHLGNLIRLYNDYPHAAMFSNDYKKVNVEGHVLYEPVEPRKEGIVEDYFEKILGNHYPFWTSVTMMKKTVFLEMDGFDELYSRGEDQLLWLKTALSYPVAVSSYVGGTYLKNNDSLTSKHGKVNDACIDFIEKISHKEEQGVNYKLKEYQSKLITSYAIQALLSKDYKTSRTLSKKVRKSKRYRKKGIIIEMLASLGPMGRTIFVKYKGL